MPVAFDAMRTPPALARLASHSLIRQPLPRNGTCWSRHAGKSFDGIDFKARIIRQATATGKPIQVSVSLRNSAGHPVCIRRLNGEAAYDVLIRYAGSGQIAEMPMESRLQGTFWVDTRTLDSGETVVETLSLQEFNKIRKPGDYEIIVAISLVGDVNAVYVDKPLSVRVGTQ